MKRIKFFKTTLGMFGLVGLGCRTINKPQYGSRNRYWGESEDKALHSVICTCTLIQGEQFKIIVDPSLKDSLEMNLELKRRTGLNPEDINAVFVTHEHGDHHAGIKNFPNAKWYASKITAQNINRNFQYGKNFIPAAGKLFNSIDVVPAIGHTPGSSGLRFDYRGFSVFVAGDAVATKDFWDEGRMYFKALNMKQSRETMQMIASISNIVVPGHDNYFIVDK